MRQFDYGHTVALIKGLSRLVKGVYGLPHSRETSHVVAANGQKNLTMEIMSTGITENGTLPISYKLIGWCRRNLCIRATSQMSFKFLR